MEFSSEINNMSADNLWNQGTLEMSNGSWPDETTFCGLCWLKLKQDKPGERVIDWNSFKEEIEDVIDMIKYYKLDLKNENYLFLQKKLIEVNLSESGLMQEGKIYSDLEISALYLIPKGNRLEIPQSFTIGNYKDLKAMLSNFEGKYKKNGFDFPYPALQVLERISNQETTNLKKTYQYFGTPELLCDELCDMTLDPMLNHSVNILEPQAGQGAIMKAIHRWFSHYSVNISLRSLTGIELMKENFQVLKNDEGFKYDKLWNQDFLLFENPDFYDYVIGNPPFSKGQDIQHFYKMYEVCKSGGTVTCIMSTSWMYNSTKKFKEFRTWLGLQDDCFILKQSAKGHADYLGVRTSENGNDESVLIKTYEAGAFKESGTNVITCVVQIKKNDTSKKTQEVIPITTDAPYTNQLNLF